MPINKSKETKKKPKLSLSLKRQIKKQNLHPPVLELLVVVINRGYGEEVGEFLEKLDVNLNIVSFGSGTAPSNLANLFAKFIITAVSKFNDVSVVLPPVAANISLLIPA